MRIMVTDDGYNNAIKGKLHNVQEIELTELENGADIKFTTRLPCEGTTYIISLTQQEYDTLRRVFEMKKGDVQKITGNFSVDYQRSYYEEIRPFECRD